MLSSSTLLLKNMNKAKNHSNYPQLEPSNWFFSKWPETLISQHSELDFEIKSVSSLLINNSFSLIQLDARLKKLIKAVLTHLELEANFMTPFLNVSKVSLKQIEYLSRGFDALFSTCSNTIEYIHSLKLKFGNCLVTVEQSECITYFLSEIKNRLNDEDSIYSQMAEKRGVNNEI